MNTKSIFHLIFLAFISLSTISYSFGQGKIPSKNKSFLGALEFLPNGKLAEGYSRVKLQSPNDKDPMVDPQKWYSEGNQQMRGMMGDAVLFLEWWTLASSPSERYKFDWTSSGYFELYSSDNPLAPIKRISRSDLAKYPNLLQRFDNITPIDINFEFTFRTAGIPDQEYADFRKRYSKFESLGSAGYSVSYTRQLDGDIILYNASRKKQDWINPGPTIGGWDTFLNMPEKYEDKKSKLIELFKLGEDLVFSSFKIKSIKWRMSDFVYIAKKFDDYESGKDKPTAFDEVADGEKKAKAGDESWDEPDLVDSQTESFYDKEAKKYGIRTLKGRVIVAGKYDQVVKGNKHYIAKIGNTAYLLNNMGTVIKTKTYSKIVSINSDLTVTLSRERDDIDGIPYKVEYGESDCLLPGKEGIQKRYSIVDWRGMTLYVSNSNEVDRRTDAQKEADEANRKRNIQQKIKETESRFESMGYKK